MSKIILGIDPGTNLMGYGLLRIEGNRALMLAMGVIDLRRTSDPYLRLGHIFQRVTAVIDSYKPDFLAIEAPFYGKNVQSMLKLGRAQGVAIAAAIQCDLPICEYEPRKIKMAITGNGAASKQQVSGMLQRILHIPEADMQVQADATDALAAAYCHFLQMQSPIPHAAQQTWKDFVRKYPEKLRK